MNDALESHSESPAASALGTFEEYRERALMRRAEAYAQIPAGYWLERHAGTFRFDNFSQLAEHRGLQALGSDQESNRKRMRTVVADNDVFAIYAGLPWCIQACEFCDLAYGRNPSAVEEREYVTLLHREVETIAKLGMQGAALNSAYFGGGTPTILNTDLLERYIAGVLAHFSASESTVITCEASPATLTPSKLAMLQGYVNRISLGVQTLDTRLRKTLGRILPKERVLEKLAMAVEHFRMVNVDIIYGMEGQRLEEVYETLKAIVALGVPSITFYRLELPEGTATRRKAELVPWPTLREYDVRLHYFLGKALMEDAGYRENPLGWFVRTGAGAAAAAPWSAMVRRWSAVTPYIGFGQGSFSTSLAFWTRSTMVRDAWQAAVGDRLIPTAEGVDMAERDRFVVKLMRLIRAVDSLDVGFLCDDFPGDPNRLRAFIAEQRDLGLMRELAADHVALTPAGQSLVHWIVADAIRAFCEAGAGPGERP